MASKMVAISQNIKPQSYIYPLFYVLKLILCCKHHDKIVLSSDTHIIIIMQDGGQDGCHNHTIRGNLSYNQYLVFKFPISCCSHDSEVLWFQLGPHII